MVVAGNGDDLSVVGATAGVAGVAEVEVCCEGRDRATESPLGNGASTTKEVRAGTGI